jgi:aquaporin Z
MDVKLRMYLAELLGTFAVVLAGAATWCAAYLPGDPRLANSLVLAVTVALAQGCAVAVALSATYHVSNGYLNPAVTVAQWVLKRIDSARAAGLIAAQLLGAVLAGLVVHKLFAEEVLRETHVGTPHILDYLRQPDGSVSRAGLATAVALELAFTFLVTVAVFASFIDPRAPRLGGVLVGMAQIAVILAGFHLTGGSANPARWFGTVVWQPLQGTRPFAEQLPYWAGPIFGALAGAIFYTAVILPPEKK